LKIRIFLFSLFIFLFSLLPGISLHAQSSPWWLSLEQGKQYFRNGAYGHALLAFEDARRARGDRFSRMESDLILALSTPALRRFGDSLDGVEAYCIEYRQDTAAQALRDLYYLYPKELLGGSVRRVLEEVDRHKAYPEAEFWMGEAYRAEGELGMALRQYQKALDERSLLETPGFEVEILYRIVEIHRIRQEYQEMENRAREILADSNRDVLWSENIFARAAMSRILENDGIGRFLTLYRYNNTQVEKAHRLLGLFYYASNRHLQAAEHLMFVFLIQNTVLIEEAMRRQYDFTFTTLDSLMEAIQRMPDLLLFLEETEYFRSLYCLATSLYATGKLLPARQIWTFLSSRQEAREWQTRAQSQLRNPFIDRAIESP
jgi:tetratricopeptide (TPR) repeat protein